MEILKVVEALQSYQEEVIAYKTESRFAHTVQEAISLLIGQGEQIADLQNEARWIPVSERCPDAEWILHGEQTGHELEVIVKIEYAETATVLFYDGHDGEKIYYPVSHWKPMPKPPEVQT